MNIKQFIDWLNSVNSINDNVLEIEKKYQTSFPTEIKKILSVCKDGIFFDDKSFCRLLANIEILNAEEFLHVSFREKNLLPLFEKGDNDFIAYNYKKHMWLFINIVDESIWGEKSSLAEILL